MIPKSLRLEGLVSQKDKFGKYHLVFIDCFANSPHENESRDKLARLVENTPGLRIPVWEDNNGQGFVVTIPQYAKILDDRKIPVKHNSLIGLNISVLINIREYEFEANVTTSKDKEGDTIKGLQFIVASGYLL